MNTKCRFKSPYSAMEREAVMYMHKIINNNIRNERKCKDE